ncbi:uncharacterized protein LOC106693377 [Microplitis demolitor]|uniref:uncharacterized protein LOC106693377 n=1 Tax=Microplitis demolitor TaxID=69319 RepID=UPI0004CD10F3|nr:uncharacterized protein LOC106693377 [Microplitis demolitor]
MSFVIKTEELESTEEIIVQEDVSSDQLAVPFEDGFVNSLSVEMDPLGVPSENLFREDQWICGSGPSDVNPEVQSIVEELLVQNQRLMQLQQLPIDLSGSGDQVVEPVPSTSSGDVEIWRLLTRPARRKSVYNRWVRCPAPEGVQSTPQALQEHSKKRKRSESASGGSRGVPEPKIHPQKEIKFLEHSRVRVICGDTMAVNVPFRLTFVEGHTYPLPFTDPLVGLLAPMTSLEASWLVGTLPWPLMGNFIFESLLALVVAMCPMHLWDLAEGSPPRIRIIIEELWDKCSSRVARCVYCGNGRRAQQ